MKAKQVKPSVYWVGAIDWDRRLFDALISLPDGTSYNAYLVQGSQKVEKKGKKAGVEVISKRTANAKAEYPKDIDDQPTV